MGLAGGDRGAAWRGVGSLLRRIAPLSVRCQPQDLGLSTHVRSPHFLRPTLFLYDRVQGGVGLAEALFLERRALFETALDVVSRCSGLQRRRRSCALRTCWNAKRRGFPAVRCSASPSGGRLYASRAFS
jgi:ATP-dependent helicase YprA (DUF1998 family)